MYLNQAAASMVQMNIEQAEVIALTPEDGSGAFELRMNIFKVRGTTGVNSELQWRYFRDTNLSLVM